MSKLFDFFIKGLYERLMLSDILGLNVMNDLDLQIAREMGMMIPDIQPKLDQVGAKICQDKAFDVSICNMAILGQEYVERTEAIVNNARVLNMLPCIFDYFTYIDYHVDDETREILTDTGRVNLYQVPDLFDEVSPMYLAHEHVHALKGTNYREYQDLNVYGDVVPLFFDLLLAEQANPEFASILLRNRLYSLKKDYNDLLRRETELTSNEKYRDIYILYSSNKLTGVNSLYYALRLFEMYKKDNSILDLIKEVLDKKKTTREILEELHILRVFNKDMAKKEIDGVMSKIKV